MEPDELANMEEKYAGNAAANDDHEHDDLLQKIAVNFVIVRTIFTIIPMKTLQTCARVCKLWNDISKAEKERRARIYTLHYFCYSEKDDLEDGVTLYDQTSPKISRIMFEPALALVFCTNRLFKKGFTNRPQKKSKMTVKPRYGFGLMDYLHKVLPSSCLITGAVADGVIGPMHQDRTEELEKSEGFTCMLFPKLPNILIKPYYITHRRVTEIQRLAFQDRYISLAEELGPSEYGKLIGTLMFRLQYDSEYDDAEDITQIFFRGDNCTVCAGAFVNDFIKDPRLCSDFEDYVVQGLAFYGPVSGVRQSTLIINDEHIEDVFKTMSNFRDFVCSPPMDFVNFAFSFACCGRGRRWYNNIPDVESGKFGMLFPTVPLFGLFGTGEIGRNLRRDLTSPMFKMLAADDNTEDVDYLHAYTTSLIVCSLDPYAKKDANAAAAIQPVFIEQKISLPQEILLPPDSDENDEEDEEDEEEDENYDSDELVDFQNMANYGFQMRPMDENEQAEVVSDFIKRTRPDLVNENSDPSSGNGETLENGDVPCVDCGALPGSSCHIAVCLCMPGTSKDWVETVNDTNGDTTGIDSSDRPGDKEHSAVDAYVLENLDNDITDPEIETDQCPETKRSRIDSNSV